jgi:Tfp pilus assembly protein PilO
VNVQRYSWLKVDAVGIGVCVAVSLVFYWASVQPLLERQRAAAAQRRELNVRQDEAAELKAAVSTMQKRLADAEAERAAGTVRLETATRINTRVAGLTQLLSDCRLEVDDVQTARVSRGPQYDLAPITITGRGSYVSSVRFLRELRSAFPDMSVARIDLTGQPGQAAETTAFQFDLLWYAAPDRSVGSLASDDAQYAALER